MKVSIPVLSMDFGFVNVLTKHRTIIFCANTLFQVYSEQNALCMYNFLNSSFVSFKVKTTPFLSAYWCTMNPELHWQNRWSSAHDARNCLTDGFADNMDGWPYNYWSGKNYATAWFEIDLGCRARITRLDLRNSHNGKYCNRYKN